VTDDNQNRWFWKRLAIVVALLGALLLTVLPLASLFVVALRGGGDAWPHLVDYVLPATIRDTVLLLVFVTIGTSVLGVGTAWLTTLCRFPGRRFFTWALMLPLAIPTYIAAYCMVEVMDYSGPLQGIVRSLGNFESARDYWFPEIRSVGGAALIFSLVLYPYVYLTTRLTFSIQGASILEVARTLGASPWRVFLKVALPLVRPAVAAGVALALMESLNDIGAVEYLGVRTITFAVFETWLNRDNLEGAVQLSLLTLTGILALIWLERSSRANRNFSADPRDKPPARLSLSKPKQWAATLFCSFVLLLGFGAPVLVLGSYASNRMEQLYDVELWNAVYNTFKVAGLTGLATVAVAYFVLLVARISGNKKVSTVGKFASLGYAVPGTVLAIGLLVPLASFDNWLDGHMREFVGISTGLALSGSIAILIYACSLRFMAIAWGTLESAMMRVSEHVDMAARGLGRSPFQLAWQVHTPIMKAALGAAFLLVFVDTTKELSATLLLRPVGFQTLATLIYDYASQAAVEEAAVAALSIVALGLVPVIWLTRTSKSFVREHKKNASSRPA